MSVLTGSPDRWSARLFALLALIEVAACTSPAREFAASAFELGLPSDVVLGTEFRHIVYRNDVQVGNALHVYIEGDGTPYVAGIPAKDPTPRHPLVLRLLALDPSPAVHLGRPCYHGLAETPPCSGRLWTSERYSDQVVSSMAAAARRLMVQGSFEEISWFGYSGGGTLAVLLAERIPDTSAIVTIGANLDIDAWSKHHRYRPLRGSLNPRAQPPLPNSIRQIHYAGGKDRIVPPALTATGAFDRPGQIVMVDEFDHVCCWEAIWPSVLANLAKD